MNTQFLIAITLFLVIVLLSVLIPENKKGSASPAIKKDTANDRDDCEWC
jgi:cbb3-type cytochrome oxidase subunit 3